ncbi:MAG: T9SS type A sorting domain-containing protein [candidate division Zixibacteria bacterium]|nr:T9SS type A sorting domain-containing protein [candidate division Zixibacteria bacterium]
MADPQPGGFGRSVDVTSRRCTRLGRTPDRVTTKTFEDRRKKSMRRAILVSICAALMMVTAIDAGTANANDAQQQSQLEQRTLFYQRTLTLPMETTLSQRALLAVSLAASELQMHDPQAFDNAYRAAVSIDNYRSLSDTTWVWATDHWEYLSRTSYSYNGQAFPSEVLGEQWNGSQWVNSSLTMIQYDGNGQQTVIIVQSWSSGAWENQGRTLFEYDVNGNELVMTTQIWDDGSQDWVNVSRTRTEYDGMLLESSTSEIWDSGAWRITGKSLYEYNQNDQLASVTNQFDLGSGLEDANRNVYTYDADGNRIQSLTEQWNGSSWTPSSRISYTYDAQDREIISTTESYFGGFWQPSSSDTTKYDGDRIVEEVHVAILFGVQLTRTLYEYDDVNMTETTTNQTWVTTLRADATADWVNTQQMITVFEEFATAVQIESEPWSPYYELGQNFPNPFNPTTVIHYSLHRSTDVQISVYNVLGQHVVTLEDGRQEPGVYETRWNGTDASGRAVPSGVYFYRMKTDSQIETRKMLLLK